jgi:hypothetical protein
MYFKRDLRRAQGLDRSVLAWDLADRFFYGRIPPWRKSATGIQLHPEFCFWLDSAGEVLLDLLKLRMHSGLILPKTKWD